MDNFYDLQMNIYKQYGL